MDGGNNHGSRFHTLDGMLKFGDITRYSVGSASPTVVTLGFFASHIPGIYDRVSEPSTHGYSTNPPPKLHPRNKALIRPY